MHVVFTLASIAARFGGPSRSVPALVHALEEAGVSTSIISLREIRDRGAASGLEMPSDAMWIDCRLNRYLPIGWPRRYKHLLCGKLSPPENKLLHDTGLWLPSNRYAAQIARKLGIPRVVSPRGMLSSWALQQGGVQKKVAWRLYQKHDLETAQLLHATAPAEADEFRNLQLRTPIAVIPNGVAVPTDINHERISERRERIVLFLSRLHPKKGLLDLVNAWALLRPRDWRVVVAGNDEDNHRETVENAVRAAGIEGQFEFVGSIEESQKWSQYQKADLFSLPSYSENFGLVVAEALAAGVPVITTRSAPWKEIEDHRCGWWTETGVDPLVRALREATACSDEKLRAMGSRGRALIQSKYAWPAIGRTMTAVYRWLLGEKKKPDCVRLYPD